MRRLGRLYSAAADSAQGGAKERAQKHQTALHEMATGGMFGGGEDPGEWQEEEGEEGEEGQWQGGDIGQDEPEPENSSRPPPITAAALKLMSAKEVKQLLVEKGVPCHDCLEKADFIRRYFEEGGGGDGDDGVTAL